MIQLTKINGELIVINGDRIECVETKKKKKISMDTGRYYLVQESVEEIIQKTIEYNARIKEFERTIRRH